MLKEKVIVLRKMKYREADLILHCLGKNGEKLSFLARSALKSQKRFGGGILEPIHYIEAHFKNKSEEPGHLIPLESAQLVEDFSDIRKDYDRLTMVLQILEVINKISQEGDFSSQSLFNLLGHFLRQACTTDRIDVLKLQFQLKLLYQQGVLKIEDWMTDFLKLPVSQHKDLVISETEILRYSVQIQYLIDQFVMTAETH